MSAVTRIKICGVTRPEDARCAVEAGADAIGLNFWSGSSRHIDVSQALAIRALIPRDVLLVGVFVDEAFDRIEALAQELNLDRIQLHGAETRADLERLGPRAFKAVRLDGPAAVARATDYPGEWLLVDAWSFIGPGGTGTLADWSLAAEVACQRPTWLAGGLTADNVAAAIVSVRPMGVDVASGVECSPGVKDPAKLRAFVAAVRAVQE